MTWLNFPSLVWNRICARNTPLTQTTDRINLVVNLSRINLFEWLPQARKKYKRNALDYDTQAVLWPMPEKTGKKKK